MSVQSKILSPVYVSSGSDAAFCDDSYVIWSPSPSPDKKPRHALLRNGFSISSGSVSSRHNRTSRSSASGSTIHQTRHPLASTIHQSRNPLASTSRQNRHSRPYIPASPDYNDSESSELLMLHTENETLRDKLDNVQGHYETLLYMSIVYVIHELLTGLLEMYITSSSKVSVRRLMRRRKMSRQ